MKKTDTFERPDEELLSPKFNEYEKQLNAWESQEKEKVSDTTEKEVTFGDCVNYDTLFYDLEVMTRKLKETSEKESVKRSVRINVIDTPGHVDYAPWVVNSLHLSDGGLFIVDYSQGMGIHVENLIRKAISERVKPVLVINKIDMAMETDTKNVCYQNLKRIVEQFNVAVATYDDKKMGDIIANPRENVVYSSCEHSWGFTLDCFSRTYEKRFGLKKEKVLKRIWGDHYFNTDTSKWVRSSEGGKFKSGFEKLCLAPIYKIFNLCRKKNKKMLKKSLKLLKIEISEEEFHCNETRLIRLIMNRFLPIQECLVEFAIIHLPSTRTAQQYRAEILYPTKNKEKDIYFKSIQKSNVKGPFVFDSVRVIINKKNGIKYAFGRLFGGSLEMDYTKVSPVQVMINPVGGKTKMIKINSLNVIKNGCFHRTSKTTAGNLYALQSNNLEFKNATISIPTEQGLNEKKNEKKQEIECRRFRLIYYDCRAPLMKCTMEILPSHLPKIISFAKKFNQANIVSEIEIDKNTGMLHLCGCGEYNLRNNMNIIKRNCEVMIEFSKPFTVYCETVLDESDRECLSKSPNKHWRIFSTCSAMEEELIEEIITGSFPINCTTPIESKQRMRYLVEKYDWERNDARRIWSFGPSPNLTNFSNPRWGDNSCCVINCTKGVQYLDEIKESVKASFQWTTNLGVLCDETVMGVVFRINDVIIPRGRSYAYGGGGQCIPMARRSFMAAMLTASPTLKEPVFRCEIFCDLLDVSKIYSVLNMRRGTIFSEKKYLNRILVSSFLPVSESWEVVDKFKGAGENVSVQLKFDHWENIKGCYDPENDEHNLSQPVYNIIKDVRKRKGLREDIPSLTRYLDKL